MNDKKAKHLIADIKCECSEYKMKPGTTFS